MPNITRTRRMCASTAIARTEVARPIADQLGILLIRGVEITKPDPPAPSVLPDGSAHFNALFVSDANALNTPDLMQSLRAAKAQHAFVFWNHPRYGVDRAEWFRPIARAFDEGLFQGMELVNGPDFYEEAYPWVAERKLTILATSDGHDPMPSRATGFRRPITLLFVRSADADGVREALEARRTAAWLGEDVWGAEELLKGLWDGAISVRTDMRRTPGAGPMIVFRNASAIPMRVTDPSAAGLDARRRRPDSGAGRTGARRRIREDGAGGRARRDRS